jgi:DNA adenine methylase
VEVYNDADGELCNAFRQAKNHPHEVIREIQLRPNSRADFYASRKACGKCRTEIQRAACFLHERMISFGGDGKSFGVQKSIGGGACNSKAYLERKIIEFAARFDRVSVENLDWRRCLDLYDKPSTFFFLDPPYCGGSQGAYASWKESDFEDLRDKLISLRGRWLLTLNDSPALRAIFSSCVIRPVDRAKGIAAANKNVDRYHELIITPN